MTGCRTAAAEPAHAAEPGPMQFSDYAPTYAILMLAAFVGSLAWSHNAQRQRFNDLVVELTAQFKATTNERLEWTS